MECGRRLNSYKEIVQAQGTCDAVHVCSFQQFFFFFFPTSHSQYDHPKWFLNKELNDCNDILKQCAKLMLPGRDKKGRRIYLSRMCK